MDVPNSQGWARHRWRPPLAALLMLGLAGFTGSAQAVEFDETLRAPAMKSQSEFKTQAQKFSTTYAELRETAPEQLITNAALVREQFDLRWQFESKIDARQPLDELAVVGLVSRGDGSYSINTGEHPEWNELHELIAGTLSRSNLDTTASALVNAGFRPQDVETLKQYVATHNPEAAAAAAALPITLSFGRTVRKYDRTKRPVPHALVTSYLYQRARATREANRLWVQGLLERLDAQRGRVLLSAFTELKPVNVWIPENLAAGYEELLTEVRRPNFEERAKAEAAEVSP